MLNTDSALAKPDSTKSIAELLDTVLPKVLVKDQHLQSKNIERKSSDFRLPKITTTQDFMVPRGSNKSALDSQR